MTRLLAVTFLLLIWAPASADDAADRAVCFDGGSYEAVAAACGRLLAGAGLSDEERVDALYAHAEALYELGRSAEAADSIAAAIASSPDEPRLHRLDARIQTTLKNYDGALAAIDRAIELDPDRPWDYYVRGFVLERLKREEEALAAFGRALELRPGYTTVLEERGDLYRRLERYEEALADFDLLIEKRVYEPVGYVLRGDVLEALARPDEALRDYRTAQLLDPNVYDAQFAIEQLLPELPPAEELQQPYAAPERPLAIEYLRVKTEPLPERDEMEEAIGDLVGWFAGPPEYPKPSQTTFIRYEIRPLSGGRSDVRRWLPYPDLDSEEMGWSEQDFPQFFAIWPGELGGNPKAPLSVAYDRAALARLWELSPGQELRGRAKMEMVCPAGDVEPDPIATALGCTEGVERVPLGSLNWRAEVEGWESLLVPAGTFSTLRIRASLESTIHVAGGTIEQNLTFVWWYAPEARWWVRRAQSWPNETEQEIMEAVSIAPLD